MRNVFTRALWWRLTLAASGIILLTGCDPTTKAAIQDGVINASTSWLTALLQAMIQLGTDTSSTTAMLIDSVSQFYA